MFCAKCGSAVADGASFCAACGQAVAAVSAAPSGTPVAAAPVISAARRPVVYAGFWLRLVAYLIDGAVLSAAFCVIILVAIPIFGVSYFQSLAAGFSNPDPAFTAAMIFTILDVIVALSLVTWLYYAFMESSTRQGTLGKMALGLSVTDMQDQRVSFGRASGRFFAKLITGLIPFAIGYIMAGFTEKKQALHDMIASCLVLRKT